MPKTFEVSVICFTYNHEQYIAQALESFINQKTTFKYNILVHDDASTDNTASIIKEYEKQYPDIIKGIYQKENQYSKGLDVATLIVPYINSKYVAMCEGDDYWCDKNKLQLQYDALENNNVCYMSVHKVQIVDKDGNNTGRIYPDSTMQTRLINQKEFINMCTQYSFQTSSYFLRAADWIEFVTHPPKFRLVSPVGDEPTLLYFATKGDVYYIDEIMSSYRRGIEGSWSSQIGNASNLDKHTKHLSAVINMLKEFNNYSKDAYGDFCNEKIGRYMCKYLLLTKNCKLFFKKENYKYRRALDKKQKLFITFAAVIPSIAYRAYLKKLSTNGKER